MKNDDHSADAAGRQAIIAKVQRLLEARTAAIEEREAAEKRLHKIDRDLWDSRIAGRLFGVNIELPEEIRPRLVIRPRPTVTEIAHAAVESALKPVKQISESAEAATTFAQKVLPTLPQHGAAVVTRENLSFDLAPPTIRDIVTAYLQRAGHVGAKAGPIRKHVEGLLNRQIHYKTIGMTLYRLSQENLAWRDKFTWFYGPSPSGGTKKPGSEPPGSETDYDL